MTLKSTLAREARVALSTKAQPVWFRLTKWIVIIAAIVWLWPSAWFWWYVFGALALSISLHLFWRWKTRNWTQPWGGWNDLESSRKP